jgi:hypothetical protein
MALFASYLSTCRRMQLEFLVLRAIEIAVIGRGNCSWLTVAVQEPETSIESVGDALPRNTNSFAGERIGRDALRIVSQGERQSQRLTPSASLRAHPAISR